MTHAWVHSTERSPDDEPVGTFRYGMWVHWRGVTRWYSSMDDAITRGGFKDLKDLPYWWMPVEAPQPPNRTPRPTVKLPSDAEWKCSGRFGKPDEWTINHANVEYWTDGLNVKRSGSFIECHIIPIWVALALHEAGFC